METLDYLTSQISYYYTDSQKIGSENILSNIKRIYPILKERSIIKQVGRRRTLCQTKKTKNIQPKMSDLPFATSEPMKPLFRSMGIDLFGPVTIKERRARLKRWGAIHLEVVEGYDTVSFIGSLQRFVNGKEKPGDIYSDCGTNLKGTTSELNIEIQPINEYLSNKQVT